MLLAIKSQKCFSASQLRWKLFACLANKTVFSAGRRAESWHGDKVPQAVLSRVVPVLSGQSKSQSRRPGLHSGATAPVALGTPSLPEQFPTVAPGLQWSSGVKSIILHAALYQPGLPERVKWSAAMLFELIRDIFNLIKVVSTIDFGSFNYRAVMASGSTDLWWALSALAHIEEKALCLL